MNYHRFFYWLRHEFRPLAHIKWFVQRGVKGYSNRDLWDLEHHLSGILSKALVEMADISHGHPCRATEMREDGAGPNCEGCKCAELWDSELRENAEKFRLMYEDDWGDYSPESVEAEKRNYNEATSWLAKNFGALWD